jgi:hypothetical protein
MYLIIRMAKSHTRKVRSSTKKSRSSHMGLKKLRSSFDHMEKFVEHLRPKAKHSFSDAVSAYKTEWHRVFKKEISPADASSYLKFRFGLKGKKDMTRRSHMRGGSLGGAPLAGAPLDYSLRAGVNGTYGQFPTYQQQGLDRYYGSALSADCGKPNGFPTDGSAATQKGGGMIDGLFRPLLSSNPPNIAYTTMMTDIKGTAPYPSSDPTGLPAIKNPPTSYITNAPMATWARTTSTDIYR